MPCREPGVASGLLLGACALPLRTSLSGLRDASGEALVYGLPEVGIDVGAND